MENLGVMPFGDVYRGRRVLVTGHTGFKGSWLALWLQTLGADVTGISLPPASPRDHWNAIELDCDSRMVDIRDAVALRNAVRDARPEMIFHLAAQSLVRRSYSDAAGTFATNVMGTVNVLDACRDLDGLTAIVVVTTDKCYQNREWPWGYREVDALGGHDPYSASKAAAEIVAASYRDSFFAPHGAPLLATARAGNVIGGGDWSEDRLVPDLIRAAEAGAPLVIRSPRATRPWQHVLDSLSGYLLLGQRLHEGRADCAEAWNFGPSDDQNRSVAEIVSRLAAHWPALRWQQSTEAHPHEAGLLYLDSSKARQKLGWRPMWNLDQSLAATADWYREFHGSGKAMSRQQLRAYQDSLVAATT